MQLKRLLAGVAIACISSAALADGRTAAHNFFTNLSKARLEMGTGVNEGNTYVTATLVRGLYALTTAKGEFAGFVNEEGTVQGDGSGFKVVSTDGAPMRPMTPEETAAFRQEVVAAIDRDKLLKVTYGKGGDEFVEVAAVDCGVCQKFEGAMNKPNKNATIYIAPGSLKPIDKGGATEWRKAANLWCTNDGGRAWRTYWDTLAVPAGGACAFADPRVAEYAHGYLQSILNGVGIRVSGTPAFVSNEGALVSGFNEKVVPPVFRKPLAVATPSGWLSIGNGKSGDLQLASAENPYQPQRVNASWSGPVSNNGGQTRTAPGKINLGTALKGLFGK